MTHIRSFYVLAAYGSFAKHLCLNFVLAKICLLVFCFIHRINLCVLCINLFDEANKTNMRVYLRIVTTTSKLMLILDQLN